MLFSLIVFTSCNYVEQSEEMVDLSHRGILIDSYGNVISEEIYVPGIHLIEKGDSLLLFPITEKKLTVMGSVITDDEKLLQVKFDIRFKPNASDLIHLYKTFGLDYEQYIVKQESLKIAREVIHLIPSDRLTPDNVLSIESQIASKVVVVFRENFLDLTSLNEFSWKWE